MTTITREQQKQILIDTANHVISRDNTSPYSENLRELARIALASLEAEPIGAFHIEDQQVSGTTDYIKDGEWPIDNGVIEVYAAPPASVVPDERAAFNAWNNEDNLPIAGVGAKNAAWLAWQARASLCGNSALNVPPERPADSSNGDDIEAWFDEGWNACRAAMLQSKYRDLSQPVDPQISEYEKIMQRAGWVMVPVEPTDEMIEAAMNCEDVLFNSDESFCVQFGNIYEAMLAAAPKPEANNE
ncbi:hypothetical protein HGJ11_001831 [Salmonella enterica]|nr:hypothetical protein [Salmonella enterica]